MDTETSSPHGLTTGQGTRRAGCGESRTSGSAGGLGKRAGSNPVTAPQADPTKDSGLTLGLSALEGSTGWTS